MDIAAWLRNVGLERYEQVFRDNAIDGEVLPDLNDGDLEWLGIPLGHRKRLLRAIARLHGPPLQTGRWRAARTHRRRLQRPAPPRGGRWPSCSPIWSATRA